MSKLFETDEVKKDALISECGKYRYWLSRQWNEAAPFLFFIMLNPSTADDVENDATIRRCIGFAKRDGFGGIWVENLFSLRTSKPKELLLSADPVGPEGNTYFSRLYAVSSPVIFAWGAWQHLNGRDQAIMKMFEGCDIRHLGLTKGGHPRHPLYIPADQPLLPWRAEK